MSDSLQKYGQLQERFDNMNSEKEKAIHTLNRDVTRLGSEISRIKKVHDYEKARRIELEQREEMLSSKISEREISNQHAVESLEQEYNRKIGELTRRHSEERTSATTASATARELRKRLDLSEKAMKERSEKEVYIVKKLEDQLSNAIIEIRRKNNELEDAKVAVEVHTDAKMRLQSILETQRVEIEQLREYRSISSKLNGEIEENAREKAHLESAMKTLRHEVDKLRHENLQMRTQLSKLNPIQTSFSQCDPTNREHL